MRILMVTSSYPLFEGDGTAPFIEEIARGVVGRGHEVDVVLPEHRRWNREDEPGLRFFPFAYAPFDSMKIWGFAQSLKADRGFKSRTLAIAPFAALATRLAVRRRLKAVAYDIVHAHWVVPGAVLSRAEAKRARAPFVVSVHGSDVFAAEKGGPIGAAARAAFSMAGAVTACSSDLRERVVRLGASPERTRTVPYGVDVEFFGRGNLAADAKAAMRNRLGVPDGRTLVVAVGRLVEKKGFEFAIRALEGAAGIHLALVGDGDLERDLADLASRLRSPVTLAGRFSREEIRAALHAADIVAVPSVVDSNGNVDGLPNTLLEAMAAGRPIVASRVAGIPDVLSHESNGLLVEPRDPPALHAAIQRLAADQALAARLGGAASQKVRRDLTWDRLAAVLEESYVQASALAKR
jgi:glycosyltransferase involved in cell wall biosynthesis